MHFVKIIDVLIYNINNFVDITGRYPDKLSRDSFSGDLIYSRPISIRRGQKNLTVSIFFNLI